MPLISKVPESASSTTTATMDSIAFASPSPQTPTLGGSANNQPNRQPLTFLKPFGYTGSPKALIRKPSMPHPLTQVRLIDSLSTIANEFHSNLSLSPIRRPPAPTPQHFDAPANDHDLTVDNQHSEISQTPVSVFPGMARQLRHDFEQLTGAPTHHGQP
ncbi:hypothetical protein VP01_1271g8 [Puccinia sorghi]|uniref:Uncharacterized protein n=1 Tax=Puccinia sorghi TaxID=27349 RepID=A0A0L6VNY4_9BASI|nr:hypothetical protein VP01_1271g8 [Puccinia sorghi]